MKIVFTGSRTINQDWLVDGFINQVAMSLLLDSTVHEMILGGAAGADRLAAAYCTKSNGFKFKPIIIPAEWNQFGRKAGFIRNGWMLDVCSNGNLIGIWDMNQKGYMSSGTLDMLAKAVLRGMASRMDVLVTNKAQGLNLPGLIVSHIMKWCGGDRGMTPQYKKEADKIRFWNFDGKEFTERRN